MVNKNEPQLLFVYGTLKKGHSANNFLNDGKFVGSCSIPGVLLHLGRYPGLIDHSLCRVTGEVWRVDWNTLMRCDEYESVGSGLFHRRQIATPLGMAWTYYYGHPPRPIGDHTLVVDRGVWHHSAVSRCNYTQLLDYFKHLPAVSTAGVKRDNVVTLTPPADPKPPKAPEPKLPNVDLGPGFEVL